MEAANCIGSIDGHGHVYLKYLLHNGTLYFCFKQKFSVMLLTIVDPNYTFIFIDVGCYRKEKNDTIFQRFFYLFYHKFVNNQLNIYRPKPLPGRHQPVPHVFIDDGGFKLEIFLLFTMEENKMIIKDSVVKDA